MTHRLAAHHTHGRVVLCVAIAVLSACGGDAGSSSDAQAPISISEAGDGRGDGSLPQPPMDAAMLDAADGHDAPADAAASPDPQDDAGSHGDGGLAQVPGDCPQQPCFIELAESSGLRDVTGYGRGAAFVDADSDGWDDLFVADTDSRFRGGDYGVSTFYRNRGDGSFQRVDWGLPQADVHGAWVGAFADYDNDGDPDLLIGNGGYTMDSTAVLYENRLGSEGRFVDRSVASGMAALTGGADTWWGATWGDYDNDGLLDVVLTRRTGEPLLLHNGGDGTFADVSVAAGVVMGVDPDDDIKNPLFFDLDDDGDLDLYIAGIGNHALFENLGAAGFRNVTAAVFGGALPVETPFVFAAVAEDFDQDGRDDLYLGRWDRQDMLMHNRGGGVLSPLATDIGLVTSLTPSGSPAPYENTMGLGVGDLFDDGFPDVLIGTGNPSRASYDIMFCNDGSAHFTRCSDLFDLPGSVHFLTRGHAIVLSDFDHDGDTDVFRNLGGHPSFDEGEPGVDSREYNKLHVRQAVAPGTATLMLEGVDSNRDAVGARVKVEGAATRYYRIRSTQGFQSQNSHALTITLGGAATGRVTVTWPSGTVTVIDVARGQRLHVREGAGIVP